MRRILHTVLLAALLACCLSSNSSAADVSIFPTGPVFKLTGLVWGTSTQPGFNNNYFFTPLSLNESVCVYVKNNNPTNPHSFTASIVVTSDPANTTPSDGTWQTAASSSGLTAAISPGLPAGIGSTISGVSQVSINFSASAAQGGSPDTANVSIVQTSGSCFSGNQFIGSYPVTVSGFTPIQAISDGLSQSFFSSNSATNPTSPQLILSMSAAAGARNLYFDRVVLTATAAVQLNINEIIGAGATCGGGAVVTQEKIQSAVSSTAAGQVGPCTTNPTASGGTIPIFIGANQTVTVDLRGFIALSGTGLNNGLEVLSGTVTGTVTAVFFWYEK